jgi:hypothetical protein
MIKTMEASDEDAVLVALSLSIVAVVLRRAPHIPGEAACGYPLHLPGKIIA